MTPNESKVKCGYYWPQILAVSVITIIVGRLVYSYGYEHKIIIKSFPSEVKKIGPLMVWTGQSDLGYTRVELWRTDNAPYIQDMVIQSSGNSDAVTIRTTMVKLPDEIATGTEFSTLFVQDPQDPFYYNPGAGTVAAVAKNGTLKLFSVGIHSFLHPCEMKPATGF